MAEAMEEVEAVYMPEEEAVTDIPSCLTFLTSKIQRLEEETSELNAKLQGITEATSSIKQGMRFLANLAREQEILNAQQEFENPEELLDTSFNEDKLSPAAKNLIQEVEGPLDPERFKDFLIKSFGKPLPSILPIVRGYTHEVLSLCDQLQRFKLAMKEAHRVYMSGPHKLDTNLEGRIDRLLKNITKEFAEEGRDGRRQTAITDFTQPQ